MVDKQSSSRSLNAFSDDASATEGDSLFHGLTTRMQMQLAFGRVGIGAAGTSVDAHEDDSQLAHRKTRPEPGSGYRGKKIICRDQRCPKNVALHRQKL